MLARDGVRLGRIDDNPFRAFVDEAGDVVDLEFSLNVTHGPAGIMGASAGDPRAVVADLAGTAREALSVEVTGEYDAVVAVLGATNPLREDGRVVIPAALPEGAGEGTGEQRFYERLSAAESPAALYEEMRAGYEPGAQRAFVVARTLREHDIWITNSQHPDVVEDCLMHAADSVEDAVEAGSDVLVVPDALSTLLV
jgi:nickel-dependent lactate racemase